MIMPIIKSKRTGEAGPTAQGEEGGIRALPSARQPGVGPRNAETGQFSRGGYPAKPPQHLKRRRAATLYPCVPPNNTYPTGVGLKAQAERLLRIARRMTAKRSPGRPPKERVTEAVALYLAGKRGPQVYNAVIPKFSTMSHWRRVHEIRKLDAAIRSRLRRMKQTPAQVSPAN